jgi:hypothetical protein
MNVLPLRATRSDTRTSSQRLRAARLEREGGSRDALELRASSFGNFPTRSILSRYDELYAPQGKRLKPKLDEKTQKAIDAKGLKGVNVAKR